MLGLGLASPTPRVGIAELDATGGAGVGIGETTEVAFGAGESGAVAGVANVAEDGDFGTLGDAAELEAPVSFGAVGKGVFD